MTVYAHAYVYRNATITVDDTEYPNQLVKCRLVPSQEIQTQKTLVPDGTIVDVDTPVWSCEMTIVQSSGDAASLYATIRDADLGQQMEVVLQPKAGTSQDVATFTIVALALPFGGDQGSFNPVDATFPVAGQPVFSTSASS